MTDGEMITCEGCGRETPADEIFNFSGSPLCPPCRLKYTGADPEYEKDMTEFLEKREAKWDRWKASVKKPALVSVRDPDKDGSSRITVGGRLSVIVIMILIMGWLFYEVGPAELLASVASFDLKGKGMPTLIGLTVCIVASLFVRTTFTVNNKELRVKTTPVPLWVWNRRVPLEDIRDLDLERYQMGTSTSDSPRKTVYRLNLITESGGKHRLTSGQSHKATYFIEKTLKAMLAERHDRFPEEWKAERPEC